MKSILIALQFLTRLPIRLNNIQPNDLARSMAWFPLVGSFIGGILVLINYEAMIFHFTPEITAGLLALALIIITGGLHLDGLADMSDGFYAGKTKGDIIRIMDDSHTGAMGVIGIVIVLLLKYGILVSLLNLTNIEKSSLALLTVPVVSRWGMVMASALLPPAKTEGLGQSFLSEIKSRHWIIATIFTGIMISALIHQNGFILCMVTILLVVVWVLYIRQRLGGLTGDTLGAINEILEVGGLFTAYLLYKI